MLKMLELSKQFHPEHYHIKKKESFQVLWGDLDFTKDSVKTKLKAGDIVTIDKMEKHSFSTQNGVVFEEVSTTAFKSDSVYTDVKINKIVNRKTSLRDHWMKF